LKAVFVLFKDVSPCPRSQALYVILQDFFMIAILASIRRNEALSKAQVVLRYRICP
jgi:hypothetical protein